MQTERPTKLIDPVCGMTVDVVRAEKAGLLLEHDGRTFAFCRDGCRSEFVEAPDEFVASAIVGAPADSIHASGMAVADLPLIDDGMRRWYESCSCCLSDAYPEIKAQLDAERAARAEPPVDPGICDVAEAAIEVEAVAVASAQP
jgi:YHS domain-containing protein